MEKFLKSGWGFKGAGEKLKTDKKPHRKSRKPPKSAVFNLKEVKLQFYDYFVMFIVRLLFYAKYAAPESEQILM